MSSPPSPVKNPRPCIAELLRTRYYPPSLTFRIERIIEEASTAKQNDGDTQQTDATKQLVGYRLLLSDGELMVNATLKSILHRLIRNGSARSGSLIEVTKYAWRKAKRLNGRGTILYLGIEYFQPLPDRRVDEVAIESRRVHGAMVGKRLRENSSPEEDAQGMIDNLSREEESFSSAGLDDVLLAAVARKEEEPHQAATKQLEEPPAKRRRMSADADEEDPIELHQMPYGPGQGISGDHGQTPAIEEKDDDLDDFETAILDSTLVDKRRQALSKLSQNIRPQATCNRKSLPSHLVDAKTADSHITETETGTLDGNQSPRDHSGKITASQPPCLGEAEQQAPLPSAPVHTLLSLLKPSRPLPQKTYRCTIFGLVSWVSRSILKKPGFPPKRHLKVHDLTIASRYSGVSISIFHDALNFVPNVGSIALFQGLTAQWWEKEVILNAYERDCREDDWVIWDEKLLEAEGFDVHGLRSWWDKRIRNHAAT